MEKNIRTKKQKKNSSIDKKSVVWQEEKRWKTNDDDEERKITILCHWVRLINVKPAERKKRQHRDIACRCRWWFRCTVLGRHQFLLLFVDRRLCVSLFASIAVAIRALMTANMWHYSAVFMSNQFKSLMDFIWPVLFKSSSFSIIECIHKRLLAVVKRSCLPIQS